MSSRVMVLVLVIIVSITSSAPVAVADPSVGLSRLEPAGDVKVQENVNETWWCESGSAWRELGRNATRFNSWSSYLWSFLPFADKPCWAQLRDDLADMCTQLVIPHREMIDMALTMADCSEQDDILNEESSKPRKPRNHRTRADIFLNALDPNHMMIVHSYMIQVARLCDGWKLHTMNDTLHKQYSESQKCTRGLQKDSIIRKTVRSEADEYWERILGNIQSTCSENIASIERHAQNAADDARSAYDATMTAFEKETARIREDLENFRSATAKCQTELTACTETVFRKWKASAGRVLDALWESMNIMSCYFLAFTEKTDFDPLCVGDHAKRHGVMIVLHRHPYLFRTLTWSICSIYLYLIRDRWIRIMNWFTKGHRRIHVADTNAMIPDDTLQSPHIALSSPTQTPTQTPTRRSPRVNRTPLPKRQ